MGNRKNKPGTYVHHGLLLQAGEGFFLILGDLTTGKNKGGSFKNDTDSNGSPANCFVDISSHLIDLDLFMSKGSRGDTFTLLLARFLR